MRSLRVLPADLPDVPDLGRGDGFAARAHLSDEGWHRGARADDLLVRRALRPLPRLPGLCDCVPVGCAVRTAHRKAARANRASSSAQRLGWTLPVALAG